MTRWFIFFIALSFLFPQKCWPSYGVKLLSTCPKLARLKIWQRRYPKHMEGSDSLKFSSKTSKILKMRARVQLRFYGQFSAMDKVRAKRLFLKTQNYIKSFFQRYGIELDLIIDLPLNPYPRPTEKDQYVVYLIPKSTHSMSEMFWGLNFSWPTIKLQRIYLHEFLHLLGLNDEYPEAPRAVITGEKNSIMRNFNHPQGRLYPRHVKTILAPLCPSFSKRD